MKTNNGKISMITFGLIMAGLLSAAAFGFWALNTTGFFSRGMFQSHSVISYGTDLWGIILAVGVILLMGTGAISWIKNNAADQNNSEMPSCPQCGEELANADGEFCSACGEAIEVK